MKVLRVYIGNISTAASAVRLLLMGHADVF
jgi:hypothetical protein